MNELERRLRLIARGNHVDGYKGVVKDPAGELDLSRCSHRHPTTREAYDCARDQIVRKHL